MYPEELHYTRTHEWVMLDRDIARIGITFHQQKELDNIVYVELPELNTQVEQFVPFGVIESVKTMVEVCAPLSGRVIAINEELEEDPTLINQDPYGDGWIVEIEILDENEIKNLMTSKEYQDFLLHGGEE